MLQCKVLSTNRSFCQSFEKLYNFKIEYEESKNYAFDFFHLKIKKMKTLTSVLKTSFLVDCFLKLFKSHIFEIFIFVLLYFYICN